MKLGQKKKVESPKLFSSPVMGHHLGPTLRPRSHPVPVPPDFCRLHAFRHTSSPLGGPIGFTHIPARAPLVLRIATECTCTGIGVTVWASVVIHFRQWYWRYAKCRVTSQCSGTRYPNWWTFWNSLSIFSIFSHFKITKSIQKHCQSIEHHLANIIHAP